MIPSGFVDIHSHLLPGIDDGAGSIEDTKTLISKLRKIGFSQFITTPHIMSNVWENTSQSIEDTLITTNDSLLQAGFEMQLRAGAEYMMDGDFMNLFTTEPLRTIKEKYVLVEMSYINPPLQIYEILFDLQVAGYTPILAHPERYNFYHHSLADYRKLKTAGCLFQINLLSTVGYYGPDVAAAASMLLREGLIDFAGSDVHHRVHISALYNKVATKDVQPIRDALNNNAMFKF